MKYPIAVLAAVAMVTSLSCADIIHVPDDYGTIQAGINAASNGDTVLVADGNYSGSGNVNIDFGGRAIVVMSENGPENCIISCAYTGRAFYFHSGETSSSVLDGFTVQNGISSYGGGMNITSSSPLIMHCIIANNNGTYGGGIYISSGSPIIVNCTISGNSATNGGAVYATNSNLRMTNSIVAFNTASG